MHVFAFHHGEHLLGRAVLRDIVPRFGVELGRLVDHVEGERRSGGHERLGLGDMDREVRELARLREVELVVDDLRVVRLQVERDRLGRLAVGDRQGADRNLNKTDKPLPRGGRVGDHHLAAVDGVDDEFVGDELVEAFAVLVLVAVAVAVEVLADEDLHLVAHAAGRLDFLVERPGPCCRAMKVILPSAKSTVVLARPRRADRARPGRTSSRVKLREASARWRDRNGALPSCLA